MKLAQLTLWTFIVSVAAAATSNAAVPPDHAQRMERGLELFQKSIRPLLSDHS